MAIPKYACTKQLLRKLPDLESKALKEVLDGNIFLVIKPSIIQLCKQWSMSVYRKAVRVVWPGKQICCDPVLLKAWSGEQLCLLTLLSVLGYLCEGITCDRKDVC